MKMTSAKWVMFAALATVLIVAAKVSAVLGESRPNAVVDGTVSLVVIETPDERSHEEELR